MERNSEMGYWITKLIIFADDDIADWLYVEDIRVRFYWC